MSEGRGSIPERAEPWVGLSFLCLAVAALVGMAEAGALVRGASPTGQYSPGSLFGFGQISQVVKLPTGTLTVWSEAAGQFGRLGRWLRAYSLFDLLFIAGYVGLGHAVFSRCAAKRGAWLPLLAGVAGANLVEQIGLWVFAAELSAAPGYAWWLHLATLAKWLGVLALAVWFVCRERNEASRGLLRKTAHALKVQRFSAVVVALLLFLAVARLSDVLEQLPDIERAWLGSPRGLGQLGLAVAAQLLLAALLFLLGRRRVHRALDQYLGGPDRRRAASYLPWVLLIGALLVVAVPLSVLHQGQVDLPQAVVAAGVLAVVALGSFLAEREAAYQPPTQPSDRLDVADLGALTQTVGDALALAAIAVTGIGVVRSMTAPALLGAGIGGRFGVALMLGLGVAVLTWPLGCLLDRMRLPGLADAEAARRPGSWAPLAAVAVPFLLADVFLLVTPLAATHFLGVLGTAVVALGSLGSLLSLLAYRVQTRQPLPLFRAMGLASTPVISLLLVISVIGGLVNSRPGAHLVHRPAGSPQVVASSLDSALQAWLRDPLTTSCARSAARTASTPGAPVVRVEPLVLVAVAGGGIRAAWWAERTLGRFVDNPCREHAIFAVSAVSGGSVGTAVLATAPSPQAAHDAMTRLAGPDALAAAMDGLLLRDTVTGVTGIGLPSLPGAAGTAYPDRAALMEAAWESPGEDPWLKQPFPLRSPLVPWRLLFNSTAVGTGCRAVITDSALAPLTGQGPPASGRPAPGSGLRCDLGSGVVGSGSYDFFGALPCMAGIPAARAAQLSARFPFVTPSGSVAGCPGTATGTEQFVDGGYSDSSGLATLADLAPALTAAVRDHNASALSRARPGTAVTLVVPVVAALGNSAVAQASASAPAGTPEPLVPTHAKSLAGTTQLTGRDALLQRLLAETAPEQWLACLPTDGACLLVRRAVVAAAPDRTVVVSPRTQPVVPTPLGWTLSPNGQTELDRALAVEARARCGSGAPPAASCPGGVGYLGDLLGYTGGPAGSGAP